VCFALNPVSERVDFDAAPSVGTWPIEDVLITDAMCHSPMALRTVLSSGFLSEHISNDFSVCFLNVMFDCDFAT